MNAAGAVAAGILGSKIIGFARERVFAHYLGNDNTAGAFRAALRIPNMLQNLFGEGALSASFIPIYAKLRAEGKDEEARRVASVVFTAVSLLAVIMSAFGVLASGPLTDLLAPGFEGETRDLTVKLVRIMFPGMGILVIAAWCLGVLNSHRRFLLSYIAPVAWNVAMIVTLIACGSRDDLVEMLAWSTVVGALLQLLLQLFPAIRANGGLTLALKGYDESVRRIGRSFLPALMSRGVVQINAYVDQVLASFLGAGIVAAMNYSQTIYMLPVSLFGMAVSAAELPAMSSLTGNHQAIHEALKARQAAALRRVVFFIAPSTIACTVLGDVVVGTLFQTGRFKQDALIDVWAILAASALGLLANTQGRLVTSAFWALHDTKTPMRISMLRLSLSALFGWIAVFPAARAFGWTTLQSAAALALGSSLAGWCELLLVRRALQARIGVVDFGAANTVKLVGLALLAAVPAYLLKTIIPKDAFPVWLTGFGVMGVYAFAYGGLGLALKVPEATGLMSRGARFLRVSR